MIGMVVLCLGATFSFAQDDTAFRDQINKFLGFAEQKANELGFTKTHNHFLDRLNPGDTDSITLELDGGKQYMLIGVCDTDCKDLDMRLLDSDGTQVAVDTLDDDLPVLEFAPSRTGKYKIQVKMIQCSNSPCYYGVGAFGKDAIDYPGQIRKQLGQLEASLSEKAGLIETHDPIIDRIRQGEKDTITVELTKGMVYMLVGVCDQDCVDINIEVFDSRGKQVASDTKVGDTPAVVVEPEKTGTYKIQVSMEKCSNNPCFYGVGVYGK